MFPQVSGSSLRLTATKRSDSGRVLSKSLLMITSSDFASQCSVVHHKHFRSQAAMLQDFAKNGYYIRKQLLHGGSQTSSMVDALLDNENENKEIKIDVLSDDGIIKISLNRTQKANAMGKTMLSQLQEAINMLNSDSTKNIARCIILTSQSEKVFSAGADLKERSKMTIEEASSFVSSLRSTFDDLANLPMPVIACVEGLALGGGLEIALTADIIIAGKNAIFGLPETSLAIIPGAGGTQRLPRLIGSARAKELIFTGKKINSSTALEYGMVQYEVDGGKAESKAIEIAAQIVSNGPLAIRAAKRSINQGTNANIETGLETERKCYTSILLTKDRLEGLQAFKEKRKPCYRGE